MWHVSFQCFGVHLLSQSMLTAFFFSPPPPPPPLFLKIHSKKQKEASANTGFVHLAVHVECKMLTEVNKSFQGKLRTKRLTSRHGITVDL